MEWERFERKLWRKFFLGGEEEKIWRSRLLAELRCASVATEARAVDTGGAFALGVTFAGEAIASRGGEGRVVGARSHAVQLTAFELLAALRVLIGTVARVTDSLGLVIGEGRGLLSGTVSGFGEDDGAAEGRRGVGEHGNGRDHADASVLLAKVDGRGISESFLVNNGNAGLAIRTIGHGDGIDRGFRNIDVVSDKVVSAVAAAGHGKFTFAAAFVSEDLCLEAVQVCSFVGSAGKSEADHEENADFVHG
jgi:hypothetical protein